MISATFYFSDIHGRTHLSGAGGKYINHLNNSNSKITAMAMPMTSAFQKSLQMCMPFSKELSKVQLLNTIFAYY